MRNLNPWRAARWTLVIALTAVPAPGAARFLIFGKKKVERIQVVPPPAGRATPLLSMRPAPPAAGRKTCVDVRRVGGAQVFGDASVELTLQGGARWRMYFAQACPALSFYDGFYYRAAEQGRLCAGRDAIIARSGGECQIDSIMPQKPLRKLRRPR